MNVSNQTAFATYERDVGYGGTFDYAMNRYYAPGLGRFTTPDPYQGSAQLANPPSWNRYSYVENDPVNGYDPRGLEVYRIDVIGRYPTPEPESYHLPGSIIGAGGLTDSGAVTADAVSGSMWLTPQDRDLLQVAFDHALEVLQDPECRSIYGRGGTRLDPATVLTSIKEGGKYGSIRFENKGPKFGVASTSPTGGPRPSLRTGLRFPSVKIEINSYTQDGLLYWNDGNTCDNTETSLHELGHALRWLGAPGGEFKHNDRSDENQDFNRNLISEKCLRLIQW
jgi:RHS repeat-associated protein